MFVTTKDEIVGRKITKEIGIVVGNTVKSRFFIRDFFASIRNFLGREVIEYTEMLTRARETSLQRMQNKAEELGANAVVNVRFMTSDVAHGAAELLAYGTAVVIEDA